MKRLIPTLLLLFAGCQDVITVDNRPADITSIGPIEVMSPDSALVSIQFSVRDAEGDDVSVLLEICNADGTECGAAVVDPKTSDKLPRTSTAPKGTDVAHVAVWDAACGRFIGSTRTETEAAGEYIAKMQILDFENAPVESAVFDLSVVSNLDEIQCER